MRQLFPVAAEVDPWEAYGRPGRVGPRPGVRLNMIASVDGAAALAGRSGALGGPDDKALFGVLRALADVILVGAGTMRTEGYGPVRLAAPASDRRRGWGLEPVPAIAVVTRSCALDWDSPFFRQAERRPLVLTVASAPADRRDRAAEVADVVVAGDTEVEMAEALSALGERGYDNVLAEGGPRIAGQLAAAGLLDEVCLTVSPVLASGDAGRILHGDALAPAPELRLRHVLEAGGFLFLRYRRDGW